MRRSDPALEHDRRIRWAAPLLLVVLTFAAYAPVLRNGFVWDDEAHITGSALNVAPGGWARIWASADAMQYYPLTFSLFRLEHILWGFDPRGYHLLNVLLHALNAVGVALVLKRLRVPGAWWAAALFALHPMNVESVAWATELKNVLCLLFALAAADRWLAFGDSRRERDYRMALLAYAACLLSKTAAEWEDYLQARAVLSSFMSRTGSLDEFLNERYCTYSWYRGRCYRTEVHHQPWPLQPVSVEVRSNTMGEPLGLKLPARPDLCHFSRTLKMLAWAPESLRLAR